jgi:hypothetical protein
MTIILIVHYLEHLRLIRFGQWSCVRLPHVTGFGRWACSPQEIFSR